MKNKLLIFLGIFIFMIIPKNVFAKEIYPYGIVMNNTNFTNSGTSYNNRLAPSITANNGTYTLNVGVDAFDYFGAYGVPETHEGFSYFPYTLIYFQTWNTPSEIGISKSTACNESCFGRDNITLKQIGKDASSGRYRYILILENKKWKTNAPANLQGSWLYHIDDVFTFTNKHPSTDRAFIFYQVLLTDDTGILNNNSIDIDSMIQNANNNTAQIQNAINSMSNSVSNSVTSLKDATNNNWNNFNNTDLSSSDKQNPDTTDYSNYQTAENNLFGKMNNADINNMNIAIDANSSTWVWSRVTEWLASNQLLMSFLISMLSIGIIKMALGR